MINKDNIKDLLLHLGFEVEKNIYSKYFEEGDFYLKMDFDKNRIMYPEDKGLVVNERQTCNLDVNENFVVFECVHRLFIKGYKPEHIELEPKWKLGHGASGGRADIFVKDQQNKPLLIIECKTAGKEFDKAWKDTLADGGQLFSYIEQEKDVEFVCLYASNFDEKNKVILDYQRIISHTDNKETLTENTKLKGFKDAKNVKERYKVWKDTYLLESMQVGIFEDNIQAYTIGKDKYTLATDTKVIDSKDIKGKYHEFRTILRKFNVSRRENAFEVLVNLFLCKLVDEMENPNDLRFYWKGMAYDNYQDFVDRLQELYKIGMNKFLQQDIVYISNKEIDEAFWAMKQKRNATKDQIKEIFRTLKFYNGNDFGFISVRNKDTFQKNAKILLEIVQMWQGLRLKTQGQTQFLGDMFEFFLDNGIKQSEGQFFTPVPICKFIVMSLPLENLLQQSNKTLQVIDYACGSGHFLTEYALQIEELVKKYKQVAPNEYYKGIYGIEKEDRLAKVAKVSAFMYGRDEINILDADALATNPAIKDESFDVLIANPPFAVEDFLMTLDETDREKYELINTVNDLGNKNIQCFFLERTQQLLAGNGVAGIIVPSSILSNSDTMHIATREILLKYFDFVSIVELGSGTFGKTGTNTVVLFIRRKAQRPEPALHFQNRAKDFFENWEQEQKTSGGAYLDLDTIKQYCRHIDIPFETYQTLLSGSPSDDLLETEMFKDYKTDFDKLNKTIKLKEAKNFKAKTPAEQQTELNRLFLEHLKTIEEEKLYYFMLSHNNPQPVLLIKSPNDNKEQKQFLGYEWSGSKGSEGIKYNGGDTVNDIITPMFDPEDRQNAEKINYLIQQNFQGNTLHIPDHLQPFASTARLEHLLDFSKKDFNKGFSLTPKNMTPILTKWGLAKISDAFLEVRNGKSVEQFDEIGKFKVSRIESIAKGVFDSKAIKWTNDDVKDQDFLQKGDILFSHINSVSHLGKTAIFNLDEKIVHGINLLKFRPNPDMLLPVFAAEVFKLDDFTNEIKNQAQKAINQASVNTSYLNELKIPLPPLSVQQQIVTECEAIDTAVAAARKGIDEAKKEIEKNVKAVYSEKYSIKKLDNIVEVQSGGTPKREISEYWNGTINWVRSEVCQNKFVDESEVNEKISELGLKNSSAKMLKKDTILIALVGATIGKLGYLTFETTTNQNVAGIYPKNGNELLPKFIYYCLLNDYETNFGSRKGNFTMANLTMIRNLTIPVPPIEVQRELVTAIEILEMKIKGHQATIDGAAGAKAEVMKRYL